MEMEYSQEFQALIGGIVIFLMVFVVIAIVVGILMLVAQWKLYKKAGERGWAALIPFYSNYVLVKLTWGNGWLFLFYLLPLGNIVFAIATNIKLARVFGKGGGYAAGLIFFPYIFVPMLAFGKAQYQGTDQKKSRGVIIATAILGAVWILLMIAAGVTGFFVGFMNAIQQEETYDRGSYAVDDLGDTGLADDEYLSIDEWNDEMEDGDAVGGSTADTAEDYEQLEEFDYFVKVPLETEEGVYEVPVLKSDNLSVSGFSAASIAEGIMTSVYVSHAYDDNPAGMVSEIAGMQMESMEGMPDYYSNITADELISGDGYALQQINYNSIAYDGTEYPCFDIVKCDMQGDNYVMMMVTVDNSEATENTETVLREVFEVYGIEFDFE